MRPAKFNQRTTLLEKQYIDWIVRLMWRIASRIELMCQRYKASSTIVAQTVIILLLFPSIIWVQPNFYTTPDFQNMWKMVIISQYLFLTRSLLTKYFLKEKSNFALVSEKFKNEILLVLKRTLKIKEKTARERLKINSPLLIPIHMSSISNVCKILIISLQQSVKNEKFSINFNDRNFHVSHFCSRKKIT